MMKLQSVDDCDASGCRPPGPLGHSNRRESRDMPAKSCKMIVEQMKKMERMQQMEHESAAIARALWQATSEADAHMVRSMLSPNITWRNHSSAQEPEALRGPDAVLNLLASSGERVDSLTSTLLNIFSNDNGAVLHYRTRAERGPDNIDSEVLLVLTIRSGVVLDVLAVPVDPREDAAFWGPL
jgi:hypothetical protein